MEESAHSDTVYGSAFYSQQSPSSPTLANCVRKLCCFSLVVCRTFSVIFVSEDRAGQVISGIFLLSFHSRVNVEPCFVVQCRYGNIRPFQEIFRNNWL